MIRIAHFSDLHYGSKNLAEADRCFAAAIDRAIALRAEAAVVSGDATDHGLNLHAPAVGRLAGQLQRLADHCPVLVLQGTFSHEPPGTLSIFRLLGARHPVHVAERIEQVALTAEGEWLPSADWCFDVLPAGTRALFSCLPTVNKANVAAAIGAAEAAPAIGEQLAHLLRGYAPIHRAARRQGIPTIGVSHGTVFGSLNEHGVPMAGFDHEFTTGALFAAEAQAFTHGTLRSEAEDMEASAAWQQLEAEHEAWMSLLPDDVDAILPWVLQQSNATVVRLLTFLIAASVTGVYGTEPDKQSTDGIAAALGLDMTKWWKATGPSYFNHVSKARILEVVTEAAGASASSPLQTLKKEAVVAGAEQALAEVAWLPSVLRHRGHEESKLESDGSVTDALSAVAQDEQTVVSTLDVA